MLKIKKLLKVLLSAAYQISKTNWLAAYKLYDAEAEIVFWFFYDEEDGIIKSFFKSNLLRQLGMLNALTQRQQPFSIVLGRNIGCVSNKKIMYNIGRYYNVFKLKNHSATLFNTLEQLEAQGNCLMPSLHEAKHWENKIWMHQQFEKAAVNEPKTLLYDIAKNKALPDNWIPPFLVKDPHSAGSGGVYKVSTTQEYAALAERLGAEGIETVVIQQLLNIRKDLRVILIDGEIVLHYWRINTADEWKPTSTSHGSSVDFVTFPEHWRAYIMDTYRRLNIRLAAFDVLWDNDDLTTTPIFLEVSPSFQPNPAPPPRYANIPYSEFKGKIWGEDAYFRRFIDIVFELKQKEVSAYLKNL